MHHPISLTALAVGWPHIAAFGDVNPPDAWDASVSPRPPRPSAFMTRLCYACERYEMALERERMRPDGRNHPTDTRNCQSNFTDYQPPNAVYYPHHGSRWGRLLQARSRADNWLRFTERKFVGGRWRTFRAGKGTRTRRARNGKWRACRCGAEVVKSNHFDPEVLMCLACQGLRFDATPSDNVPLHGAWLISRYSQRLGRPNTFNRETALFRPRSDGIAR